MRFKILDLRFETRDLLTSVDTYNMIRIGWI